MTHQIYVFAVLNYPTSRYELFIDQDSGALLRIQVRGHDPKITNRG
jgi:hypothetical protein